MIAAGLETEAEPLTGETPGLYRCFHLPVWQILERTRAETYPVITLVVNAATGASRNLRRSTAGVTPAQVLARSVGALRLEPESVVHERRPAIRRPARSSKIRAADPGAGCCGITEARTVEPHGFVAALRSAPAAAVAASRRIIHLAGRLRAATRGAAMTSVTPLPRQPPTREENDGSTIRLDRSRVPAVDAERARRLVISPRGSRDGELASTTMIRCQRCSPPTSGDRPSLSM
jgi:hypothetical protein